jgi:P-type conjugative transfer protein TrbJ
MKRILFVVLIQLCPALGWAFGDIVYDPTNHVENALTAANSVRQVAQLVQSYTLQVQQYLNELQNLSHLPTDAINQVLKPYQADLAAAQALSQALGTTQNSLTALQSSFDNQFRQMAVLGITPSQYLNREAQLAAWHGQNLQNVYQGQITAMQSVNDSYARVLKLQQQIPASAGMQQSFQTLNQHLNLLAGQNAQLIGLISSQQARDAQENLTRNAANTNANQIIQNRLNSDAIKVSNLHQQLRSQENTSGWGIMQSGP